LSKPEYQGNQEEKEGGPTGVSFWNKKGGNATLFFLFEERGDEKKTGGVVAPVGLGRRGHRGKSPSKTATKQKITGAWPDLRGGGKWRPFIFKDEAKKGHRAEERGGMNFHEIEKKD